VNKKGKKMKTTALKKEMHLAIDRIEDSTFLKAIYTILNDKSKEYQLTEEDKEEIDRRLDSYEKGKSKLYTWEEVKRAIRKTKK
jgi:putative addiction module component (TIGR02574 family)